MNIKIAQLIPQGVFQIIQSTIESLFLLSKCHPLSGGNTGDMDEWNVTLCSKEGRRNPRQISLGKPLSLQKNEKVIGSLQPNLISSLHTKSNVSMCKPQLASCVQTATRSACELLRLTRVFWYMCRTERGISYPYEENKHIHACLGPKDNPSRKLQNTAPERWKAAAAWLGADQMSSTSGNFSLGV